MPRIMVLVAVTMLLSPSTAAAQAPVERRPALLVPMYISQAALHGADLHSTWLALARGHRELNPLMRGGIGPSIAVKAGVTTFTVLMMERLWRRHRIAAVCLSVGVNVGIAAVAAHNYRLHAPGAAGR